METVPEISYIQASILAMEAYDIEFGICQHNDYDNPLSLVSMHRAEDYITGGRLEMLAQRFRRRKVATHLGISFLELLEMPRYMVDIILNVANKAETEAGQEAQRILNGLENP